MEIKCKSCGRPFVPTQPWFTICLSCHSKRIKMQHIKARDTLSPDLLLSSYYDEKGNLLKHVFMEIPQKLAIRFASDGLKTGQLRDFHSRVFRARNNTFLKGIDSARPVLWEVITHSAYQRKRNIIPESFAAFLKHHIGLAERSEKDLEGFYQHLDSIVCYFPK